MRKIFLTIISFTLFISSASASYIDGNLLKSMSVAPVTENSHLQFVGYVVGVIDSNEQDNLCVDVPPNALTPVLDTVINYLANNPEKLNASGSDLVVEALIKQYSCPFTPKS
ncbi:hypothetical protein ESZ36_10570 [Colwellia demingiae]|uniref:Rap1a immunity protein domain-containing protein n=1 Tax=Colwellia demingiae TaxID=89401 RepID=A0A5C6QFF5_9GAMM|nr:Rap1a/Tai family immunity protein [Colwellia demingiae]TWX67755.1 hypothetical protein ESZ36_10570 [Colwellia demingiae]